MARDGEEALFVSSDATAIADALAEYVRSAELRRDHGAAARKRAHGLFGARSIFQRHLALYRRVMKGQDAAEA